MHAQLTRSRMLVTLLLNAALITSACDTTPTAPRGASPPARLASVVTPGDSATREVVFLVPLGPRRHARGVLDTTLTPSLTVCRIVADGCGDTVARFAFGDSSDSNTVHLTSNAYSARWRLSAFRPDTAAAFRATVTLGDTTVGYTDLKIVPRGYVPPADDTARFAFVEPRDVLEMRFQIFVPAESLIVIYDHGVHGTPSEGTYHFRHGEHVPYRVTIDSGYRRLLVALDDGNIVRTHGEIVMDGTHVLIASADHVAPLQPGDRPLLNAARAILTASDPVRAVKHFISLLDSLDDIGRLDRVEAELIANPGDSATIDRVEDILAGHMFTIRSWTPTPLPAPKPPPTPPPGHGVPTAHFLPASATRSVQYAEEPLTIAYVNGVLNSPAQAMIAAYRVSDVARAAHWTVAPPLEVRLIYNRSALAGDARDVELRCAINVTMSGDIGLNAIPDRIAQCAKTTRSHTMATLRDFGEAGLQLAEILRRSSGHPTDVDSFARASPYSPRLGSSRGARRALSGQSHRRAGNVASRFSRPVRSTARHCLRGRARARRADESRLADRATASRRPRGNRRRHPRHRPQSFSARNHADVRLGRARHAALSAVADSRDGNRGVDQLGLTAAFNDRQLSRKRRHARPRSDRDHGRIPRLCTRHRDNVTIGHCTKNRRIARLCADDARHDRRAARRTAWSDLARRRRERLAARGFARPKRRRVRQLRRRHEHSGDAAQPSGDGRRERRSGATRRERDRSAVRPMGADSRNARIAGGEHDAPDSVSRVSRRPGTAGAASRRRTSRTRASAGTTASSVPRPTTSPCRRFREPNDTRQRFSRRIRTRRRSVSNRDRSDFEESRRDPKPPKSRYPARRRWTESA